MASSNKNRWVRRLVYLLVFIVVGSLVFWKFFGSNKVSPYVTAKIERGNVTQTVSLSGTVEPAKRYQLQFPRTGKIDQVNVQVGSLVKTNDVLASLEKNDLKYQLNAQKANLKITQANLNKVYAGPRQEDLNLGQLKIYSAESQANALGVSQQNALALAQRNVDAAGFELQKSQIALSQAQDNYNSLMQNGFAMSSNSNVIQNPQNIFYSVVQNIPDPNQNPAIQNTLNGVDQYLQQVNQQSELQKMQQIQAARQAFELAQLNYQEAQGNFNRSQFQLQQQMDEIHANQVQAMINVESSQQQLNLLTSPPRESDAAPLKAQVEQAQQGVNLAQYQLDQSELKAPEDGIITTVNLKKGEMVSPALSFITLDSTNYDIKALVSESDVVKLKVDQSVSINFDALDPSREFRGSVLQISPAETIVQGVVYYEVKIQFDTQNATIKPGMTANLTLNTNEKNNVVIVPTRAIQYENNEAYVQVIHRDDKNKESLEKRKIVLGLQGDENVEITQGLQEGEEIVTFTKSE